MNSCRKYLRAPYHTTTLTPLSFLKSAGELLRITPDVACYSKLLTGGMVPLAVTLASDSVYEVFRGQSKVGNVTRRKFVILSCVQHHVYVF